MKKINWSPLLSALPVVSCLLFSVWLFKRDTIKSHIAIGVIAGICIGFILITISNFYTDNKYLRCKMKDKLRRNTFLQSLKRKWQRRKKPPSCMTCKHFKWEGRSNRDGDCTNKKIPSWYRNHYNLKYLRSGRQRYESWFFYYLSIPLRLIRDRNLCGRKGKFYEPIPDIDREHLL